MWHIHTLHQPDRGLRVIQSVHTGPLEPRATHTHTLDSALVNSHWVRHVWTPGILIFTSLLIYLHLSFSSKIRITCMMQTKGPDVHASVNQHVFASLIFPCAKCSALRNVQVTPTSSCFYLSPFSCLHQSVIGVMYCTWAACAPCYCVLIIALPPCPKYNRFMLGDLNCVSILSQRVP